MITSLIVTINIQDIITPVDARRNARVCLPPGKLEEWCTIACRMEGVLTGAVTKASELATLHHAQLSPLWGLSV